MENVSHSNSLPHSETIALNDKSIFLIEDNDEIRDIYKMVLEEGGFSVTTAVSGSEALDLLSHVKLPDLILLDHQLGDMTGTELLPVLERKRPELIKKVPVVFLSGMDELPLGKAVGRISKPVGFDKLLEAANHYIKVGTDKYH
jgi:CheY-like chemotaxis protein